MNCKIFGRTFFCNILLRSVTIFNYMWQCGCVLSLLCFFFHSLNHRPIKLNPSLNSFQNLICQSIKRKFIWFLFFSFILDTSAGGTSAFVNVKYWLPILLVLRTSLALNKGADAYIIKPLDMEKVLATIEEQLKNREKNRK